MDIRRYITQKREMNKIPEKEIMKEREEKSEIDEEERKKANEEDEYDEEKTEDSSKHQPSVKKILLKGIVPPPTVGATLYPPHSV